MNNIISDIKVEELWKKKVILGTKRRKANRLRGELTEVEREIDELIKDLGQVSEEK